MIIRIGDKGPRVRVIQRQLNISPDGIFGPKTKAAIEQWQKTHGLVSDGIIGPASLKQMRTILEAPSGLTEIYKTFGCFLNVDWFSASMARFILPQKFKDIAGFNPRGFYVNALLIPMLEDVFQQIPEGALHSFDGCYNIRATRKGSKYSTHSWGIALDLNAATNRMGQYPRMPKEVVKSFKDLGWVWGGDWKTPDGMHFQFAKRY